MYLNFTVKIPDVAGKLLYEKRGDITYVKYEYDRVYVPEKKYTLPKRATIGKVYLGDKSLRVHTTESASAKIFIEFIALIIRNKIYTCLIDEMKNMEKKPNYMTVPAALKELEKIEMVRQTDNIYRLDHAVTATQKKILKAFGLTENYIKHKADDISGQLKKIQRK